VTKHTLRRRKGRIHRQAGPVARTSNPKARLQQKKKPILSDRRRWVFLKNEAGLGADNLLTLHDHNSRNARKKQKGGCHLGRFGNRGGLASNDWSICSGFYCSLTK
jgi:hypothetical protein